MISSSTNFVARSDVIGPSRDSTFDALRGMLRRMTARAVRIVHRSFRSMRSTDTGTLPRKPDRFETFGVLERERLM